MGQLMMLPDVTISIKIEMVSISDFLDDIGK